MMDPHTKERDDDADEGDVNSQIRLTASEFLE